MTTIASGRARVTDQKTFYGTTILAVRYKDEVVVAGDGQVTLGDHVVKHRAKKVRRIYNDRIIVGFAGATADSLNLCGEIWYRSDEHHKRDKRPHFVSVSLAKGRAH